MSEKKRPVLDEGGDGDMRKRTTDFCPICKVRLKWVIFKIYDGVVNEGWIDEKGRQHDKDIMCRKERKGLLPQPEGEK